jgi:hypothetical protein
MTGRRPERRARAAALAKRALRQFFEGLALYGRALGPQPLYPAPRRDDDPDPHLDRAFWPWPW